MVAHETAGVCHQAPYREGYQPRGATAGVEKKGLSFRRIARKLLSHDPRRGAILARIRTVWRHLPTNGIVLFFDVKPITVKAYGGRRYTSASRLVLERRQKTRGRFYLFLAYEVNSGRRRWVFLEQKDSNAVGWFMKQVCRWYPDRQVWVVLDRDSPHPCKSRQTRSQMRKLGLHWITLPTGSPDDNPVEGIFSDIQLMILDNSNDPDSRATKRRISDYLRQCNRRPNRKIRIPSLPDSHKHS